MLSVMVLRLGLLPSCLMVWRNSGSSGKEKPLFSCLSRAKLFTFQRPNSLQCYTKHFQCKDTQHMDAACRSIWKKNILFPSKATEMSELFWGISIRDAKKRPNLSESIWRVVCCFLKRRKIGPIVVILKWTGHSLTLTRKLILRSIPCQA